MKFTDFLADIFHTLWAHKLRTALTMFGIAWGIISITLMTAAGEGLRSGQQKQMESLGKDLMIVFSGRTSLQAGGQRAGRALRWRASDYIYLQQNTPACDAVLPEQGRTLSARSSYNSASVLVDGSLPRFAEIRSIPVAEGRFTSDEDERLERRVAFLGSEVRKQLFGARQAIGETIQLEGIPYRVIGIMKHKEQDSSYDGQDISKIFIPFRRIVNDFPEKPPLEPGVIDRFLVTPKSLEHHEACKRQVRQGLAQLHHFDPNDEEATPIWDTIENAQAFRKMTDGMKYFLGAVGFTTLFIGGIGVMNVMLIAVREQTREIGIRRAIGATARSIRTQFLVQTFIVVFASGGLGLTIAYGLCSLVNLLPMPPFFDGLIPPVETGLIAFLILGTVALLAAIYPANKAASIDPIEALRYETGS